MVRNPLRVRRALGVFAILAAVGFAATAFAFLIGLAACGAAGLLTLFVLQRLFPARKVRNEDPKIEIIPPPRRASTPRWRPFRSDEAWPTGRDSFA